MFIKWLWIHEPTLHWCELVSKSCPSTSLLALFMSKLPIRPTLFSCNPVVVSTLKFGSYLDFAFGLHGLSAHSPNCNKHLFIPPGTDMAFVIWQRSSLVRLRDLYIDSVFRSFSELCSKFNLPKSHLLWYFQVCNRVKVNSGSFPNISPNSIIDFILGIPMNQKGLISRAYTLNSCHTEACLITIKGEWEAELGEVIYDPYREDALARLNYSISCSRVNLIQFKVHRSC